MQFRETDADRLGCLKTLGEKVTVDGLYVWGIFDLEFLDALDGPGASSASPELTGRTSDLESVTKSTVVERENGEKFRVRSEPEPDGTGMSLLRLRSYG